MPILYFLGHLILATGDIDSELLSLLSFIPYAQFFSILLIDLCFNHALTRRIYLKLYLRTVVVIAAAVPIGFFNDRRPEFDYILLSTRGEDTFDLTESNAVDGTPVSMQYE